MVFLENLANMINETIRNIIKIFSFIDLYKWISIVNQMVSYILSINISNRFNKSGKKIFIQHPFTINGFENISIGDKFRARNHLRIEAISTNQNQIFTPQIVIGENVSMETNCHIACINKVSIGNNVLIASNVFITDHSHGNFDYISLNKQPMLRNLISKGSVIIGNNVWIGDHVTILPNVIIGNGSVIGANSVVTKDIPEYSIVAGVPAKVIRKIDQG